MTTRDRTSRRARRARSAPAPRLLAAALLSAALSSCFALSPRLPATPPPPNLPDGIVLLDLTDDEADLLMRPEVVEVRERHLEELAATDPDTAAHVLAHRVVTGMRVKEALWAMSGHPVRIREMGPPGGQILLFVPGRWFIRTGDRGTVVDAGRY